MARGALEGVRILDATISWAGPHSMNLLGDMGAEIIKVESMSHLEIARGGNLGGMRPEPGPRYPDRDPGEDWWNRSAGFNAIARNRYGITLELGDPRAREVFKRLAAVSDVVVESFRPRVMPGFGLGYDALSQLKPDLIMLSMPVFGTTGPYHEWGGFGWVTEGWAGHPLLRGYPDGEPSHYVYGDPVAGGMAAFAILAALNYRRKTGKGQFIDLAQAEVTALRLGEYILDYTINGRLHQPMTNRHRTIVPHGCYPCADQDQWVVIACRSEDEVQRLCAEMGQPGLLADERFAELLSRYAHQDELDAIIAAWTVEQDAQAVMERLQAAGVPAGRVMDYPALYGDPHLWERGFWQELTHPSTGTHIYPGMYFGMSKTPPAWRMMTPRLGEHNELILRELAGLSDSDIAELARDRVIGKEPLRGE